MQEIYLTLTLHWFQPALFELFDTQPVHINNQLFIIHNSTGPNLAQQK